MTEPSLFPEFLEAEVAALPDPPPPRQPLWIVLAANEDGLWCVPPSCRKFGVVFGSRQLAVDAASDLSPGYWRHVRIVRIPGEGQQVLVP